METNPEMKASQVITPEATLLYELIARFAIGIKLRQAWFIL